MGNNIVHTCRGTGQTFTSDQWTKYCLAHRNCREVAYRYGVFEFNIHDVCLNPEKAIEWKNKLCKIEVTVCCGANQDWGFGYSLDIRCSGGGCGASNIPSYSTRKKAVYAGLKRIEDIIVTHFRYSAGSDLKPYLSDALRQIRIYKEQFNPRQLDLFEDL